MTHPADTSTHSTAVVVSSCGNFCAVGNPKHRSNFTRICHNSPEIVTSGTRGGIVYLYNLQSGLPRGALPKSDSYGMKETVKNLRLATPGNVLHETAQIMGSADKWSKTGSLTKGKPAKPSDSSQKKISSARSGHTMQVTGLYLDITGCILVSCGLDGSIIFWNFHTQGRSNFTPKLSQLNPKL